MAFDGIHCDLPRFEVFVSDDRRHAMNASRFDAGSDADFV